MARDACAKCLPAARLTRRRQEPSPEEFFTPYIWSVVYERAAIDWAPERIVLFPLEPADGPPLDEDEGGHLGPALSTIDVDDGAVTPAQ